jgi:hypothetical protein
MINLIVLSYNITKQENLNVTLTSPIENYLKFRKKN